MNEVIQGRHPVFEALKSGRPINKILLSSSAVKHGLIMEIIRLSRTRGIPVEFVPANVIDRQNPAATHQGVIAYAAAREYVTIEELFSLSKAKNEPPLYVVLDGIEDPQNLGSVLRTADASGVHGIIIRSRRAVGLTGAVAKASAGAVEYVPVARVANISQTLVSMKRNNIWVVGIDPDGEVDYTRVDFRLPTAIVVGGEGKGLSDLVKKTCDSLASIPMRGKIASLNAAVAAAIVMYEASRQRSQQL